MSITTIIKTTSIPASLLFHQVIQHSPFGMLRVTETLLVKIQDYEEKCSEEDGFGWEEERR
jgi:hypothetical protein